METNAMACLSRVEMSKHLASFAKRYSNTELDNLLKDSGFAAIINFDLVNHPDSESL